MNPSENNATAPSRGWTVLVTGAAGFVGQRQVRALTERGHAVVAMVHSTPLMAGEGVSVVKGDMRDAASLLSALRSAPDGVNLAVIHLAAAKSDERFSDEVNVRGTANLIEACHQTGARRLVYVSTQADPRGAYGRTKLEGERLVRESDLDWTVLKPNLIYGEDPDGAFARVVAGVRKLPVVPIMGPARAKFWPIHVDDNCRATAACLEKSEAIGRIYVLAGRDGVSLSELVETIARRLGKRPRMIHAPLWLALLGARLCVRLFPNQPPISVSNVLGCNQEGVDHDITAMVEELGVEPRPLEEGLDEVFAALGINKA